MTDTKDKCYLAGPISKMDWADAKEQFYKMEDYARVSLGFAEVVNPVDHQGPDSQEELDEMEVWTAYMRESIRKLTGCDAILLAPNYHISKGARLEKYVAEELGCTVYYMRTGYGKED